MQQFLGDECACRAPERRETARARVVSPLAAQRTRAQLGGAFLCGVCCATRRKGSFAGARPAAAVAVEGRSALAGRLACATIEGVAACLVVCRQRIACVLDCPGRARPSSRRRPPSHLNPPTTAVSTWPDTLPTFLSLNPYATHDTQHRSTLKKQAATSARRARARERPTTRWGA